MLDRPEAFTNVVSLEGERQTGKTVSEKNPRRNPTLRDLGWLWAVARGC